MKRSVLLLAVLALAAAPAVAQSASAEEPAEEPADAEKSADKPSDPRVVGTEIFNQRGVLTPRRQVILEPSLQYVQSSVQRVALEGYTILPAVTIGLIDVREVSRATYVANVAARFGLTHRIELEARLPYVMRNDSTVTRPLATPTSRDDVFDVDGAAVGDTELALRYQFNRSWPYFIGNLRVRMPTGTDPFEVDRDPTTGLQTELPTGSGFWAVQPSVTWVQVSDPAVLFGNLSYYWTFERDLGGTFGTIDPGDVIGASIGTGFALNEQVSLSLGYEHNTVLKTQQNGQDVPNVRDLSVGSLLMGYSFRGRERTISISLGAGITQDAPDVQLTIRYPFTFGGRQTAATAAASGAEPVASR